MTIENYEKRIIELEKKLKANQKIGDEFWIEQTTRALKRARYLKTLKEIEDKSVVEIVESIEETVNSHVFSDDLLIELQTKLQKIKNRTENRKEMFKEFIDQTNDYAGEVSSLRVALTDQLIPNDSIAHTLYNITEEIFKTLDELEQKGI